MKPSLRSQTPLQRGFVHSIRALSLGALALTVTELHAASFTQGNVVVQQATAATQNTTITLIEVNTGATTTQSTPVQSIALPGTNTPSNAFRINGSGGTTGYLATTNDGTLLCLDAHSAINSTDTGASSAASIIKRAVLTFSSAGASSAPTTYPSATTYTGGTGNQARGATSLDNSAWCIADKGGIYTNGGISPTGISLNILAVKSFGGVFYVLQAAAPAVSTLASIGSTSMTGLPGLSALAGPTDFYLISSGVNGATFDVLYTATGTSATAGTIGKYSLVGGTWVANGTYSTSFGGSRIVAAGNGGGAKLYVAGGDATSTGKGVYKLSDTASYNTAINITATPLNLFTVTGVAKGIAFTPLASAMPDLTVSVAAPANGVTGANFNYTLTVANSGTANASGVGVQFTLPTGLTFVSAADPGSAGFTATNSSGVITFSGGTLNAGTSETLTVTVSAASDGTYAASTGAAIVDPSNSIAESNENNNSSTVATSTVVGSYPDLTVDVSGPATAVTGANFNYTLNVHNIGNAGATNITTQFTLPTGLTFVSAADGGSNGFSGANSSGVVTFTGGSLAQSASDTLTVTVSSANTGTYNVPTGAAVINPSHAISESNFSNNASVSTVSTAVTAPDLSVVCGHNGNFSPGDSADTYSIYVTNNGANSSSGTVTVSMTLPTGLTPTAADNGTINGWTVTTSGQTVTATRSDALPTNASYPVLTVTVAVSASASGSLSATVNVSGGGDVSPGNDSNTGAVNISTPTPITSAGNLIVSRSVYTGTSSTVTFPGTLPNGAASVVDGSYPSVWGNESPDAAFGVTSPIYLDQITPSGSLVSTVALTSAVSTQLGLDVSTSFPSKSELALNLTPDSTGLTCMCYLAPANALDVSNSDTPYHIDSTNPVTGIGTHQRAIVQFDYLCNVQVTPVNSYSGNNGRAAVLAGGNYFTVGNAGNGSGGATILSMLSDDTGVQMIAPGAGGTAQAVGTTFGTSGTSTGYQHGFSLANISGFSADKTGKDMNLRGLTINPFTNTLFASKGSGGNGINTVYQVGTGGIPTSGNATSLTFTIPPGLSQTSAASGKDGSGNSQTVFYPFGMWFGDANTMYVADEGNPTSIPTTYDAGTGKFTSALPANNPTAGLQKWVFDGTRWNLVYTLINGLNLGQPFTVTGYPTGNNPATGLPWSPANSGLRNITGKVNSDGTVTIYAVTSTQSGGTDQGADPNQLVVITDTLATTTLPAAESFTVIKTAGNKEVLRGVSLAPFAQPDLAISTTHAGSFSQSDVADTVNITVNNVGSLASSGTVTVTDILPTGLTPTEVNTGTINGWSVSTSGQTVTATRSNALAAGSAYPALPITVSVSRTAASSLSNTANVSGGGESNLNNDASTDTVSIATVATTPLESWRQTYCGTTETSGVYANNADYDNDGVENLVAYALGVNPTSGAGTAVLPVKVLNDTNPLLSDRLVLSFNIANPNPGDITYLVEASDDLVNWITVASKAGTGTWTWLGGGTSHIVTSGSGPVTVKVGDVVASSGHPLRVMRLKIK